MKKKKVYTIKQLHDALEYDRIHTKGMTNAEKYAYHLNIIFPRPKEKS